MNTQSLKVTSLRKESLVDDSRLKRIEDKLDVLTEAMTKLVAIETHQQHMLDRVNRLEARCDELDKRIRESASLNASQTGGTEMFEKLAIILFTGILAIGGTLLVETLFNNG